VADVIDNRDLARFELTEDGATSFADYRRNNGVLMIPHVETPFAARGKGSAGRLMEGIVVLARAEGARIAPICPYAAAWMRRHPEHADLLA
jgi:hypothetical protein